MYPRLARTIWHYLEAINAVAYFSPECRDAPAAHGLKGFWMGYFACRAAPMGQVGAGVVEATFFNFHPARVRRAIPDAWSHASPKEVLEFRAAAAATSLRRLLSDRGAEQVAAETLPALDAVIDSAGPAGRPLFAANREASRSDDPVAALWQAATTLREHRGDGHVALLTAEGLDGCGAHVLFAACEGVAPELFLDSRGWSSDDWNAAADRLRRRGLIAGDGGNTSSGRALRQAIEQRTDELALRPFEAVGEDRILPLLPTVGAAANRIASAGEIRFPNPMGLPRPSGLA
jgi:hypothetical protein